MTTTTNTMTKKEFKKLQKALDEARRQQNELTVEALGLNPTKAFHALMSEDQDLNNALADYITISDAHAKAARGSAEKKSLAADKKNADKALNKAINSFTFDESVEQIIDGFVSSVLHGTEDEVMTRALSLVEALALQCDGASNKGKTVGYLSKMVTVKAGTNRQTLAGTVAKTSRVEFHKALVRMCIAINTRNA